MDGPELRLCKATASEGRSSIPLPMRLRVATTPRGFEWGWQVSLQGYCSWLSHLKMQMRQCKSWKGRKRRKRRKWRCQIEKGLGGGRAMKAKAQHGSTAAIQARLTFVRLGQELQFLEEARIGRSFPGISQWRSIEVTTWLCDFKAAMLLSQHRCVEEDGVMDSTHTHTPEKADQKIDAEELLKTCSRTSSCTSRKRARSSGAPALLKTCSSIGHGDQEELLRSCSSVKGTKKEIVEEAPKAEKTKCKKKSLVPKTSPSSQPGVSSEIQEPHEMEAGDIQKPLTAQWANLVWFIWMLTVYGLEKARVNASGQSLPEVGPVNVPQTGPDFNFRYLVEYGLGWIKRFGRIGRIADCF